ncbi:hypothetical protein EBR25_12510 [bacterium]|nr:hypothetical protein [bacterium]
MPLCSSWGKIELFERPIEEGFRGAVKHPVSAVSMRVPAESFYNGFLSLFDITLFLPLILLP